MAFGINQSRELCIDKMAKLEYFLIVSTQQILVKRLYIIVYRLYNLSINS